MLNPLLGSFADDGDATMPLAVHNFRSTTSHLILALLGAVMLLLAFPEPGWGWLAHVALVPWAVLAIRSSSWKTLAWTLYVVNLVWWLLRLSWLVNITAGGYVALCAYMALYLPLAMLLFRHLDKTYRGLSVLLLPGAWVTLEFIRGRVLAGGFGWFALGHTQVSYTVGTSPGYLAQTASLGGEWFVSFLVAMTAGLVVDLTVRPVRRVSMSTGRPSHRFSRRVLISLFVYSMAYVASIIYALDRLHPLKPANPMPVVAVVQSNVPQSNKQNPTRESILQTWNTLVSLTQQAAAHDPRPDLIVWPETMVPAPLNDVALTQYAGTGLVQFDEMLHSYADDLRVNLLVGAPSEEDFVTISNGDIVPNRSYNSAFLYHADGSKDPVRYDKIHRVPFGEYIPWVEGFPNLKMWMIRNLSPYEFDFTIQAGAKPVVFSFQGTQYPDAPVWRVATPICFEDAVSRTCRGLAYDGHGYKRVDMLANLTNDGWYPRTHQNPQHLQIAVMRCIELGLPMVRSVNTGISGFIDPRGRIQKLVNVAGQTQGVEGYAVNPITLDPTPTAYGRIGAWPVTFIMTLTLLTTLWGILVRLKSAQLESPPPSVDDKTRKTPPDA
ncbi:MAG: apolipoprotein N-acyltransferase [Phycisphaera sp.]|nr:apolipoprotein N-acyltransferase [Phycisphaera sp.]